ncbi:hypothetical protein ACFTAO_01035 [Paenibacillus rhizoplanae]
MDQPALTRLEEVLRSRLRSNTKIRVDSMTYHIFLPRRSGMNRGSRAESS